MHEERLQMRQIGHEVAEREHQVKMQQQEFERKRERDKRDNEHDDEIHHRSLRLQTPFAFANTLMRDDCVRKCKLLSYKMKHNRAREEKAQERELEHRRLEQERECGSRVQTVICGTEDFLVTPPLLLSDPALRRGAG